jgi:integrase/recombinase XerD
LSATPVLLDSAIVAGTKAPTTIAQYRLHWTTYRAFAESLVAAGRGGTPGPAEVDAAALDPATLARWRQHLYETGYITAAGQPRTYSVNAINQRLAAIRGLVAAAAEQGYIPADVSERFKGVKGLKASANRARRNPHARTRISRAQMQAIVNAPNLSTAAGQMHRALLLTLATVGLRISEAVSLQIDQLEFGLDEEGRSGWMVHVAGKGQAEAKPRALGAAAKVAIDGWLQTRQRLGVESPYIFTGFGGRGDRAPSGKPISRQAAWELVIRYARRAGLNHVKPHDFRRYVGTQLAKQDIRLAQNQLGHKRIETTAQHYVLDTVGLGVTDDLV